MDFKTQEEFYTNWSCSTRTQKRKYRTLLSLYRIIKNLAHIFCLVCSILKRWNWTTKNLSALHQGLQQSLLQTLQIFLPNITWFVLVVTSHESNAFSMSASFVFRWSHGGVLMQAWVVRRHAYDTNTEQALLSCDVTTIVLVKYSL